MCYNILYAIILCKIIDDLLYYVGGHILNSQDKKAFLGFQQGEYAGGNGYRPYVKDEYPEIKGMMEDEYKHGDIFKSLAK